MVIETDAVSMTSEHRMDSTGAAPIGAKLSLEAVALLLWHQWKLMLAVPLLASAAAFAASFLVPLTFTAHTTFMPPRPQTAAGGAASLGALVDFAGLGYRRAESQFVTMLHSETVANRLIARFDLQTVYDQKLLSDTLLELDRNTRISIGKKNALIFLEVDDHDPKRAAALANAYVEELRLLRARLALTEVRQRRMFFEAQLKQTRERLNQAQLALQGMGVTLEALKVEPMTTVESAAQLSAKLTSAEIRLQMLRQQFAENTPELLSQATVVAELKGSVSHMGEPSPPHAPTGYISAYREFKYQEALFGLIASQFELARVNEGLDGGQLRVVDEARVPEDPSKPLRGLLMAAAFAIAFGSTAWHLVRRSAMRRPALSTQAISASWGERQVQALFLITFPCYFGYHYLVSWGVMPPFLAGYSTAICFLSLPFLLFVHAKHRLADALAPPVVERALTIFLAFYALVVIWQISTRNHLDKVEAHATIIAQFVGLYLLSRHTPLQTRNRPLLIGAMIAMSAMITHNAMSGGLIDALLEDVGTRDSLISYQGYAFAYFVTMTWTVALLHDKALLRGSIYLLAAVALFLNGARSEFAATLLSVVVLEFYITRSKGQALLAAALVVALFTAIYFVFETELADYRVIAIFTDYSDDLSVQDRAGMLKSGLAHIWAYPLTGAFGSYPFGEYVHNFLSAWVDLGFTGFMGFVLLSLLPALHLLLHRHQIRRSPELQLLLLLTCSTLLLSITAKPFTQYLLPLTLGVCARHARTEERLSHRCSASGRVADSVAL